MPEIRTVKFEPWHVKLIKEGKHYDKAAVDPETRAFIYRQVEGTTVLLDGQIAAILGVAELWPGVAEVTMIPSDVFYDNMRLCVKFVRNLIPLACETFALHRLQATSLASAPHHGRFLRFIGLKFEGLLRGYGPKGEDHEMYAYVRAD